MISRIEATRYRCFEKLDADLGDFRVLVGANGAGKSTLLDIPVLLGDLLRQRNIGTAFTERRGNEAPRATTLQELIFSGIGDFFILAVEARFPPEIARESIGGASETVKRNQKRWPTHIRYELRLQIFNVQELHVQNKYVFLFPEAYAPERNGTRLYGETTDRRDWRYILRREYGNNAEFRPETSAKARTSAAHVAPTLLALPRVQFESAQDYPAARWLHDLLVEGAVFYAPDWQALRVASPPGLSMALLPTARNLPWLALKLQADDPERYGDWVAHVRTALPQVTAITVREREEDHHAYFSIIYNGGYGVTSSGLSDGTLRILALTLPPYLASAPTLLVTEEPENGIHPRAIEAVLQSLSSMYDSQVWISSHSPVVLAHTSLEHILCARLAPNGAAEVIPGPEHPRLKDWHGTIDLGSLFAAGVLG